MQTVPQKRSLPATLFVVDDDSTVLRRFAAESLRETNLGVLTAERLDTAIEFIEGTISIGAVLADLHFRSETQSPERNIHTGLDLLAFIQKLKPDVPLYVMSMDSGDRSQQAEARRLGLKVVDWYDKLGLSASSYKPWERIERDLIIRALKAEPDFRDEVVNSAEDPIDLITDDDVAKKIQGALSYPRLTYLQYLPYDSEYWLKAPIEVHCWREGESYFARAVKVPLLVDGRGEDAVEAIEDLAEIIVNEKSSLDGEDESCVQGYAKYVQDRLNFYLGR